MHKVYEEKKKKGLVGKIVNATIGTVLCGFIVVGTYDLVFNHTTLMLRTNAKMQSGYANPKRLSLELTDLDKNGENETVLSYNFRNFLLIEDEKGNPVLREYSLSPGEKIPAQYVPPKIIVE